MTDKNSFKKPVYLLIGVFVALNAVGLVFRSQIESNGADLNMLLTANLILFLLAIFTLKRSLKSIEDPNPHAFVRSFYAGFLMRLAVVAVAAFLYIYLKNGNVRKTSLFIFMGLYAIYSIIEVSVLRKVLKENNNA
ncbi:MAG: hypothetical protein BGN92_00905 [Sphingobacteriales bacterium 41-5]|nr:MAG: hypothetical protein BGN92_00905 [Sphingobacteriales bacterium 41-5]